METGISNQKKHENYREQFRRLKTALNNGFNLEAIFIEYAIMEDRTEAILRHGGLWDAYMKRQKGRNASIESKIQYVQKQIESGNKMLAKYFQDDLLKKILGWKEKRNKLIHALLKQDLEHNEIHELAVQGDELAKQLRSRANSYNRAADREREAHT